jgi:ATP-dependent Clp protease adaptor protein ClpS
MVLSCLWIISHEIGHIICGHIDRFFNDGQLNITERNVDISDNLTDLRRSAELMADMYATFRLCGLIAEEVENESWEGVMQGASFMNYVAQPAVIPCLLFMMGEIIDSNISPALRSKERYPLVTSRFSNIFLCIHFYFNPNQHPAIDYNVTTKSDYIYNKLFPSGDTSLLLWTIVGTMEQVIGQIAIFDILPWSADNRRRNIVDIFGSLLANRSGAIAVDLYHLDRDDIYDLSNSIYEWHLDYCHLSLSYYQEFVPSMKEKHVIYVKNQGASNNVVEVNSTTGCSTTLLKDSYDYCPAYFLIHQWLTIGRFQQLSQTMTSDVINSAVLQFKKVAEYLAKPYFENVRYTPIREATVDSEGEINYSVKIINDEVTPMDFVVDVLIKYLGVSQQDAIQIMLAIHNDGSIKIPGFDKKMAIKLVESINGDALRNNFPLKSVVIKSLTCG